MANEFIVRKGLIVEGASGGTVVDIQGSQGQLFSVTDDLSGSIFAVSDISGVPIFDVNSSGVSYFDGNVGIGTDNPSRRLHVSAGNTDIAAKFENTSNNSTVLHLQTTGDGKSMYFQTDHIYVSSGAMHFGNDTGDLYLKPGSSSGVGINTTNPTGLFNSYISAARQITHNGNGGDLSVISDNNSSPVFYVKGTGTADLVNVFDNTTEVFTIKDGGNVGIGDSGPAVKLQVSTSSPTNKVAVSIGDGWVGNDLYHKEGGLLLISGTSQDSTQTGAGLAFQTRNTQNTNYWKSSIIMDRNGAMRFTLGGAGTVQGSEDLTILSGGYVGIGTTNPTATLNVKNSSAIALPATSGTTQSASALRVDNGNVVLDFGSYSSNGASWIQSSLVSNLATTFPISLNPNGGNVGIGTASPSESLEILKDGGAIIRLHDPGNNSWKIKADSDFHIYDDSNSDYLTILNNGNVGIGTTGPVTGLDVRTSAYSNTTARFGGSAPVYIINDWPIIGFNAYYDGGWKYGGTADGKYGGAIEFDYGNGHFYIGRSTSTGNVGSTLSKSTALTILNNGDVGIGTTNPAQNFVVSNSTNGQGIEIIPGTTGTLQAYNRGASVYVPLNIDTLEARVRSIGATVFNNGSGFSESMRIDSAGAIKFNAYGAGFLQTDANGNITAGSVTTSDTLDDVTDNGNSTTNSIVLGASTVNGTMLVGGSYTSGNIVVIGGMKSSGGAMIGYAVKPDTANNHGFVSSSAFTLERSAYYQQGNRHRWYAGASQDVAIGNAVSISETMRLDFDKLGLSTTNPATLLHLGKATNGTNIISLGEASIGGPHGLDFYGDDATRTKKFSIYYRTGTENISMEDGSGTKRWEISQSGAVTFNQAFTFPTADGSAGAALVTNGSGALSWGGGYQQYTPVGWTILNNQTYTSTGANISSSSTQAQAGTTPVQRNSATEFEATKAGWYEISYSFIVKNNYTNRAMIGAYMTVSTSGGGGVISGSHSTQYVRYSTYGEYAQIQNTFYYYTSYSSTDFYLLAYLLSGSMNMTTQSISQSMISFRYINNDIT